MEEAEKFVKKFKQKMFFCYLNYVDVLEIEYGLDGYNYFYLIGASSFEHLLKTGLFKSLPTNDLLLYRPFWQKYQNEIVFSVEYKKDLEILLGFECHAHTFTVVLDRNGFVINIKYYPETGFGNSCGAYNYKLKFDTGEELYYDTQNKDFPWHSICNNSVYIACHKKDIGIKNIKLLSKTLKKRFFLRRSNKGWMEMSDSTLDKEACFMKMNYTYKDIIHFLLSNKSIKIEKHLLEKLMLIRGSKYKDFISLIEAGAD